MEASGLKVAFRIALKHKSYKKRASKSAIIPSELMK